MTASFPSDPPIADQVCHTATRFGITAQSVALATGGFSDASVFRVKTDDGREFAVRRVPATQLADVDRIRELHALISFVHHSGIHQVAVPLRLRHATDNGLILMDSVLVDGQQTWTVEPWMGGKAVSGEHLTDRHVNRATALLHRFHQVSAEYCRSVPSSSRFRMEHAESPSVRRRIEIVQQLTQGGLQQLHEFASRDADTQFSQLAQAACWVLSHRLPELDHQLRLVEGVAFSLQPVIRDIWSEHVLFDGSEVSGLIDLTAAGTDHVCVDLARLQRSWFPTDTASIQRLVWEFGKHRHLDRDERRLLRALDMSTVMLSPVTWLNRRYLPDGPVIDFGSRVMQRMTWLVERMKGFQHFANV